jgi:hypothetical protein
MLIISTKFHSHTPRNLGTACSKVATEFCKLCVVGSIPVGSNHICGVAQSVERSAVNRMVAGSMPATTVMGMKRIGKQPVLKTGAREGCRFESIPCPPFRQRDYSSFLVGSSIMVVQPALNRFSVGSNPTSPVSPCQSSSSLRPRRVKPKTRARIPFGTPCTIRSVADRRIANPSLAGSIPAWYSFRERVPISSLWGCRLMVRTSDFHSDNAGSIPVNPFGFRR